MKFKKVFRGYDPAQVDKYIAELTAKEQQIRTAQKERIDELSDENYALRQQVKQYQTDEQAISKSLIASQHLAQELKFDAQKYSDLVLSRAKIFYATWRAYAKTLVASLSSDELKAFNELQRKVENVINAYEGKDVEREMSQPLNVKKEDEQEIAQRPQQQSAQPVQTPVSGEDAREQPTDPTADDTVEVASEAQPSVDVTPTETTMGVFENPITKVENAAEHKIDLMEVLKPEMSLEELCAELGLMKK